MALHNIIVERQHKFVICFIERHVKLNKNRPKELNNCVHLLLAHNNRKVKMIASFNLDIFQTVVIWMIIFWDYRFQALEIIPFTAFDWSLCCIHPPWNVSNVNFLVFFPLKYNPIVSRVCQFVRYIIGIF